MVAVCDVWRGAVRSGWSRSKPRSLSPTTRPRHRLRVAAQARENLAIIASATHEIGTTISASNNTLLGFAVLRANYNSASGSYLESFEPFVLSVLAASNKQFMERGAISSEISDHFGITVPTLVLRTLLRKMKKQGLTENVGDSAVSITPRGLEEAPALEQEVTEFRRRQSELVDKFRAFVQDRYPEHASLLADDSAAQLAQYFEDHAAPLLNEGLRGRRQTDGSQSGIDFLIAAFVTELSANDQARFAYIVEAAKGAMLAAVLLLDTSGLEKSLIGLTLVLDTPVLMDALGFHGEPPEAATQQLLAMAKAQSAKVVTFDNIARELEGIVENIKNSLRRVGGSRSTTPGYLHFADIGASAADLEIIQATLIDRLNALGIEVVNRPDDYALYGLDEAGLEDLIQDKVKYLKDPARVNDVTSLSATHRLRRGRAGRTLEHSAAVLVSSNKNLVWAASQFHDSRGAYPLAVMNDTLATLLWVRSPAVAPDAPRDILLASAYAGMQPDPVVWNRYLDEIEQLEQAQSVSADEAIILRVSTTSRQALMSETLGDSAAVGPETPLAALERVKGEATAPLEERVRELERRAEEAGASAESASADWVSHVEARKAAEKKLSEESAIRHDLEAKLAQSEREAASTDQRRREAIRRRAEEVGRRARHWFTRGPRILFILLIVGAGVWFLTLEDPADRTGVVVVGVAGFVGLLVAVLPPLGALHERWEAAIVDKVEKKRLFDAGLEDE